MTITEFLLARIAEDESYLHGGWADLDRVDTNRLEAECGAKRRIVAGHSNEDGDDEWCTGTYDLGFASPDHCQTLRALASVYADHPDYDPAWA